MLDAQGLAQPVESLGTVTRSVVLHLPLNLDAEAFVPGHGSYQGGHGAFLPLALADLAEGQAGMIIDRDVDELPADPSRTALAMAVACNAMTDAVEFTQLLDVHVDHLAGPVSLIADHRLDGLQIRPAVQAMTYQDTADGGAGEAGLVGNKVIDALLPAQRDNLRLNGLTVRAGLNDLVNKPNLPLDNAGAICRPCRR